MIEPARQAFAPMGASLSDAWSAVIGDRIAAWRLKNAATLQTAVNAEVKLFARLLARAAAGDEDAADRRHLEILTRLTPMDAKVIEWFVRESGYPPTYPSMNEYQAWKRTKDELGEGASLSIEHLITLGVFERLYALKHDGYVDLWRTIEVGTPIDRLTKSLEDKLAIDCELTVTARGMSLYKACALEPPAEDSRAS
jgi:hypothetical protein